MNRIKTLLFGVFILICLLTGSAVNAKDNGLLNGHNVFLPLLFNNYEYKETILFLSAVNQRELFTVDINGENLVQITNNNAKNYGHSWSPDGQYILFYSDMDGDDEIYVIKKDGTGLLQLTNNTDQDLSPRWSFDGTKIIFLTDRDLGSSNYEIYSCLPDGSDQTRITDNLISERNIIWSHNDEKIAFSAGGSLYFINADGTNQTQVTDFATDSVYVYEFDWSPDLSKFVFRGEINCPNACRQEIYSVNPDGSQLINLTDTSDVDLEPKFDSTGSRIVFSCGFDICIMDMTTLGSFKVVEDPAYERYPNWSRNDEYITFASNRNGSYDIYVVKTDMTALTRLTTSTVDDWLPVFSP